MPAEDIVNVGLSVGIWQRGGAHLEAKDETDAQDARERAVTLKFTADMPTSTI